MNKFFFLITFIFLIGCKTLPEQTTQQVFTEVKKASDIKLKFLDEYIYPPKKEFKNTLIGGLSGIEYKDGTYYIVADDSKNPRFYKTDIIVENNKIDTIIFKNMYTIKSNHFLDLESIIFQNEKLTISSEGSISKRKEPTIIQIDTLGNVELQVKIPEKFIEKSRHNGVFEGLSKGIDGGFWSAMELPLKSDGVEPKFAKTNSPVRFTFYKDNTATKEYIYELSPLSRKRKGTFNINGLTDILEYKKNHFLVIERTYQSGYKDNENLVKIYKATVEDHTTDVLNNNSLKDVKYTPMKKVLVFDFSTIKSKLTKQNIDNIEGISFGKKLANGNQSLILISDDNFQRFGAQMNQFILFEFIEK